MDIVKLNKFNTKIGFDIGDGITNYLNNLNEVLPINNTEKFIIEDNYIKLLEGINVLSENNILLEKVNIISGQLCFINLIIFGNYIILVNIYSKNNIIYSNLLNIKNINNKIEEDVDINNVKLQFIFKQTIMKIKDKINSNNIKFSNFVKEKIIKKLNFYLGELSNMENQKIMEKINNLKNKFLL